MKKLKVDIGEITSLMEMQESEDGYYLDVETGKTIIIPCELMDRDLDDEDLSFLSDWEKDLVPIAREVEAENERYQTIPRIDSGEAYDDMASFAETVTDQNLREQLRLALDGWGAFRRFKNVLHNRPDEADRWYAYQEAAMAKRASEWLGEIGIEPVDSTEA